MWTNNRFDLVNSVVEEALDIAPAGRKAFLDAYCAGDEALLLEADRLLALSSALDGFLDSSPAAPLDVHPGDLLGERFLILKEIGAGGTGSVFLAEDRQLGQVALKILHPEMRHDLQMKDRFFAEIKTARAVRHPHVCPVYDLFQFEHPRCGQIVVYTMKYFAGETLAQRLTQGPIAAGEVLRLAHGIASGIDALHAEGIIHRDLKPDNIMLATGRDGTTIPILMDFGLASLPGNPASGPEAISGSLQYMAPERFRGTSTGAAIDIYAFGIILFEMITGIRPFPTEELLPAAIRRVTEEPPRMRGLVPGAPRSWDQAIARALSRKPAERPLSARALVDAMEEGEQVRSRQMCSHRVSGRIPRKARTGYLRYCQNTEGL